VDERISCHYPLPICKPGSTKDGPNGDLDADLRVALLAVWVGGDRQLAADFLRQSAAQRLKLIGAAEEQDKPASLPPLALGTGGCARLQQMPSQKENPMLRLPWLSRCLEGCGKSGQSSGLGAALQL
jgi:hypothetical protein